MPPSPRRPFRNQRGPTPGSSSEKKDRGWDPVAEWYDKLVGESGSDYHQHVILPAAIRMLAPQAGEAIIDICCGQGVLIKPMLAANILKVTGVDASPRLIESAKGRYAGDPRVSLVVADASKPGSWVDGKNDAATCIMAVHDVSNVDGLFTNLANSLKPNGRAVLVLMHPCFRIPRKTHWGWDADQKIQFRRIDSYSTT